MSVPLIQTGGGSTTPSGTANQVMATPDGSSGQASLRALVANDIPSLDASKVTTGVLAAAQGGTPLTPSPGYLLLPWKRYNTTTNYTTNALGANAVNGIIITVNEMITVTSAQLAVQVNSAGATGNFYIGLYDLSGNRLLQLKFPISNNATGISSATVSPAGYVIVPGTYLYVWGSEISSANLTVAGMEMASSFLSLGGMLNAASVRSGFKTNQISGGNLTSSGLTISGFTANLQTAVACCVVSA